MSGPGPTQDDPRRGPRGGGQGAPSESGPSRLRDVPAPRPTGGLVGPVLRRLLSWPYRMVLFGVYRTGIRAWQLTLLSLGANAAAAALILAGGHFAAAVALAVGGVLDVLDGGVARLRGEEGRTGALLDSSVDRVSDAVVLGALFLHLGMRARGAEAALALTALVAALLVSDLRARAEAGGVSMTEGIFQRLERYLALVIGLAVPGALLPVLALLAGLGLLTVAQRLAVGWRRLPPPPA